MRKTNLNTQARAHAILFSPDLEQAYDKIIQFYSSRFQIKFNFRDAKQYWGLEDFMNVKETVVTNAANLSFFMVNLSAAFSTNSARVQHSGSEISLSRLPICH
jgi:putative transposase